MKTGVLSDTQISALIADEAVLSSTAFVDGQVQPASLDLRLADRAYRVRASFLAGRSRNVEDRLNQFTMHEIDLTDGAVLEKGCVYVVPLMESLALPAE